MNKEKTYILQKDLPDGSKAGDEYKWLGDPYCYFKNITRSGMNVWIKKIVENNPEWWKLKEEEKPVVVDEVVNFPNEVHFHIKGEWYQVSRERLAEILIAESKGFICIVDEDHVWFRDDEVLKLRQEAFEAARDSAATGIDGFTFEQSLAAIKNDPRYPKQTNEHNALADAKWNKELYKFLTKL